MGIHASCSMINQRRQAHHDQQNTTPPHHQNQCSNSQNVHAYSTFLSYSLSYLYQIPTAPYILILLLRGLLFIQDSVLNKTLITLLFDVICRSRQALSSECSMHQSLKSSSTPASPSFLLFLFVISTFRVSRGTSATCSYKNKESARTTNNAE